MKKHPSEKLMEAAAKTNNADFFEAALNYYRAHVHALPLGARLERMRTAIAAAPCVEIVRKAFAHGAEI